VLGLLNNRVFPAPFRSQRASGGEAGDDAELQVVEIILTFSTLSFGASGPDARELEPALIVPVTST